MRLRRASFRSPTLALIALAAAAGVATAACGSGDGADASQTKTTSGATTGAGGAGGGATTTTAAGGAGGSTTTTTAAGGAGGSTTTAAGGAGGSTTTTGTGGAGGKPGAWCQPTPTCDAEPPDPGAKQPWRHDIQSPIIVATGDPNHRGRDLYLNPGDTQWLIGKFAYGLVDKDLVDEDVDVYLLRDCGQTWEKLGTATTTNDGDHATVEGVEDSGGRVFFEVPAGKELGPGRHRARFVVQGDLSATDVYIEVVPKGTPMFVSDVDGTLTDSENAEFSALLKGALPDVHPGASTALGKIAKKGYHPMYLTARPEWLVQRTRELVAVNGFPAGIIHTTLGLTGAKGNSAATFKTDELAWLAGHGMAPAWAFGNTASDADAYENAGIQPLDHRIFYQYDDQAHGGRRIDDYASLFAELDALPSLCP
jgi:hypothetical protein